PRHPWLAAVDGLAILGIAFKTRAEAILYAERVIALEHETAGAESCPPPPAELGAVRTTPLFYSPLSGNGMSCAGATVPRDPRRAPPGLMWISPGGTTTDTGPEPIFYCHSLSPPSRLSV